MNQAPAPKKGLSTTAIVLIVVGVIFVLSLGTCVGGGLWLGQKAKEVKQNIADGGLVLVTPPEVLAELTGPKKDYIGFWTSKSGDSTLSIAAEGQIKFKQGEGGSKEELSAPLGAFHGNDIVLRLGIDFTIKVTETPHKVGSDWIMVARGITFRRTVTD